MSVKAVETLKASVESVTHFIRNERVAVFSKTQCPFSQKAIALLKSRGYDQAVVQLDQIPEGSTLQNILFRLTGQRTVPSIFFSGTHVGGFSDLNSLDQSDDLVLFLRNSETLSQLRSSPHSFDYDVVVIGGGSGGVSCAKSAAKLGKKVAIFDFVTSSPQGTTWGLGGTCVNVGCIPKKLMHQAAILGDWIKDASNYGWSSDNLTHDWQNMRTNVNNHIKSLNHAYRVSCRKFRIDYMNAYAKLLDPHTVVSVNAKGEEKKVTAQFIVLATGERPRYPGLPGDKECCITSDDLFWLKNSPGKTLVVGASYVALECAGFLHGLGLDVTVMVRSILLRGFDQQMAVRIGEFMEKKGIKFLKQTVPVSFEKKDSLVSVQFKNADGTLATDQFDTVLLAMGRQACTKDIGLEALGIKMDSSNRVIGVGGTEMTPVANVFAIGDILSEKLQLTPLAIKSGDRLAERLFSDEHFSKCDYTNIPTTVFTPLEYGCVGYSEEEAIKQFGDDVVVYHKYIDYLESTIVHELSPDDYYCKIICLGSKNEKIIGFHVLAPNAGEITQGYALGIKMGATYYDISNLVGIHPTCAEAFTRMSVTKSSKKEIEAGGC